MGKPDRLRWSFDYPAIHMSHYRDLLIPSWAICINILYGQIPDNFDIERVYFVCVVLKKNPLSPLFSCFLSGSKFDPI